MGYGRGGIWGGYIPVQVPGPLTVSFPGRDVEVAMDWENPRVVSVSLADADEVAVWEGSAVVPLPGRDVEVDVAAAWAKPVQSARVTTTSTVRVMVVMVVLLLKPTPVKMVTDRLGDVVSHEVGMVYWVVVCGSSVRINAAQ
jgi:hypothetical protein